MIRKKVVLQCQYMPVFWAVVFLLTAYRFSMLWVSVLPLHFDEAQYWIWAQNLDWGYFSKPPLIAWMIALWQYLLGTSVCAKVTCTVYACSDDLPNLYHCT